MALNLGDVFLEDGFEVEDRRVDVVFSKLELVLKPKENVTQTVKECGYYKKSNKWVWCESNSNNEVNFVFSW